MHIILNRRQFILRLLATASISAFIPAILRAEQSPAVINIKSFPQPEKEAIDNCLGLIRANQLKNGAINMRWERDPNNIDDRKQAEENKENPSEKKIDTIRVIPYFANHSALALLSANSLYIANQEDVKRAAKWAKFYVDNQDQKSGYINDYKGSVSRGTFENSGTIDSVDAYASTFLQLADRYLLVTNSLPSPQRLELKKILPMDKLINAAKLSLKAIESVTDNGLTWAKPDYKVKLLVDNVEVYGGLKAGERFFNGVGIKEDATKAKEMAAELGKKLGNFWQSSEQRFAWAIMEDGKIEGGLDKSYPHVLANLCGLAWISGKNPAPWLEINKRFAPDNGSPVERWLMAAIGVGDQNAPKWRPLVAAAGKNFNNSTNGNRVASLLLSLLEGRSWMPNIAENQV